MRKFLSLSLAVIMLVAVLPLSLVKAGNDKPATYWLDRDETDGYVGNYTLISNDKHDPLNSYVTGDLTGACYTEGEATADNKVVESMAKEDENGVITMTVPTNKSDTFTKAANATHTVGESFRWFYLSDAYEMYQPYVTVSGTYFTCRAAGEHCYVWAETHTEGASIQIPEDEAQKLAAEFDRVYATTINNYGAFDPSINTKVNILVHNLSEGISSYFYKFEYESLGNNDGQYMFHVDNKSTMTDGFEWNVEAGYEPMLSAFVDMITFMRANERVPVWFTQVLRQAAIPMVYGDSKTTQRVENWEKATELYTNGKSIYKWEKADLNMDPTYLYMFAQYLKVHYGNYEVFGNILDSYAAGTDNTGATFIPAALTETDLSGLSLAEIVEAYRIALVVKDSESIHGFLGKELYKDIPVVTYTGTGLTLPGGGAILVKNNEDGIFHAPEEMDKTLRVTGITTDIDALPSVNNVVFYDYDGTLLMQELVFTGNDAIPPKDPYRAGYTFIGWDKDLTNVTASMDVTAQYKEGETYHTITMINEDTGDVLSTTDVIRSFTPEMPAKPVNPGYAFIGWYTSDGNPYVPSPLYEDITIYARFITAVDIYSYSFTNYQFNSISTEDPSQMTIYSELDDNVRLLFAGAYYDGSIYGFNDLNNFVKIVPDTFTSEVISEGASVNSSIYRCLDMTYDYANSTMWLSYISTDGQGNIGKVDLSTGKVTKAANTSMYMMGLACNKEGKLFGMIPDGKLVSINTTNGRYAEIGDTGFSLIDGEYISFTNMMFDYNTGYLYWNGSITDNMENRISKLFLVDPTTAEIIDLGNIAENRTLHSMYVSYEYDVNTYYTVNFVDYDGTILSTQRVKEGDDAQAPADPTREGYRFTGWDKDFTNVHSDLRVVAQYEELPIYTVTFIDWDMTVLSTQQVYEGSDAQAPADPTREGYRFTGWSCDFTNVTANLVVVAQYVEEGSSTITYMLGDVDLNGTINTADAVMILKNSAELITLSSVQMMVADVSQDSSVNTADAVLILKHCAGLYTLPEIEITVTI